MRRRRFGIWAATSAWACTVGAQPAVMPAAPLVDRIWDVRARSFIDVDALWQRAAQARYVLLGEQHDSEAHHARQLQVLQVLGARGLRPTLAMEQFDTEYQAALSRAQQAGVRDAEALADAGQLNRKGWRWPLYRDLIAYAAGQDWPLVAANLSRTEARRIALGELPPPVAALDATQQALIENDVVQGHCGQRPAAQLLAGIVNAQRARDARMASVLEGVRGPVVLIAGSGHVRRDRAVPRYLSEPERALVIGFVEVREGQAVPTDDDQAGFDLLWFTPATPRPNACAAPLPGLAGTTSNSNSSSLSKESR
jgi:uncharacterized iron-regulated protein